MLKACCIHFVCNVETLRQGHHSLVEVGKLSQARWEEEWLWVQLQDSRSFKSLSAVLKKNPGGPEFDPQDPHGWRGSTPASCPLEFHMYKID